MKKMAAGMWLALVFSITWAQQSRNPAGDEGFRFPRPPQMRGGDGPWNHRVLLATSKDGLNWTVPPQALAEQASVPELFAGPAGRPILLFVDASGRGPGLGAMIQATDGSWQRATTNLRQADPNVVRLKDGTYRAYVKAGLEGAMAAYSSKDGLDWQRIGEVFRDERYQQATDPDVFETPDGWVMLISLGPRLLRCTSPDGLKFTPGEVMDLGGSVSDTVAVKGGWRTFFHVNPNPRTGSKMVIRSAFTPDGRAWKVEAGDRVTAPKDGPAQLGVADPAPLQLADGSWLMAIKSFISGPQAFPPPSGRDQFVGPRERRNEEPWPLTQNFNALAVKILSGKASDDDKSQLKKLVEWLKTSGRGPWFDEVRVATSTDGLNFSDTGQTVLRKASVPEAVVDAEGNVWLFYVDSDLDKLVRHVEAGAPFKSGLTGIGGLAAAKSSDGVSFTPVDINIANAIAGEIVDPDIVVGADGSYQLYYLGVPANELAADTPDPARAPGPHKFYLATSRDLVHWEQQGVAWNGPHGGADPAVYRKDAKTWFIIGGGAGRSDDGGKTFQQIQMRTGRWGQPDVIAVNGGFRLFYNTGFSGICSAFSKDGVNWTEEEGTRLPGGADPSVVRMKDGSYRLYYKTSARQTPPPRGEFTPLANPPRNSGGEMRVTETGSKYAVAKGGRTGSFVTGQDADLMLSGIDFNNTGGPLLFNHPSGLASDGKCLLICDRNNNRVLVWRAAPAKNTPPDLVLGQPTLTANNPGTGRHELNWPGNVTITPDGNRIAVADTDNDRILIWNSFPTKNGAPADIVLELAKLSERGSPNPQQRTGAPASGPGFRPRPGGGGMRLGWPWGVWTDGKKFAVVCTHGGAVLIWNSIPTRDNQPPDLTLTPSAAGTMRNVTSDGVFFAVSDHNNGERSSPATMVWRTFPTSATQEPDFSWSEWLKGTFTADGKLLLGGGAMIYLWNKVPRDTQTDADVVLRPSSYRNGDGPDIVIAGGRFYACNYNGNNVLVWNALPTRDDQPPDFAIGSDDPNADTLKENHFITNPVVATDGKSLFVSSDFNRRLLVWRQFPDRSGAKPDVVYSLPDSPWDNALHGSTFVLAGKQTIHVWKKLPLNGEKPDVTFRDGIGSVRFRRLTGVALDDRHLYVADQEANRIYVWNGMPGENDEPKLTLEMQRPGRLSSDGKYFAVAPFEGANVLIYRVADLSSSATPVRLGGPGRFNLPGKCVVSQGRLFVADTGNHRVHVWHNLEHALDGQPADALLGQRDEFERKPAIGKNRLFMPGTVAFGGGYLWIGEFKFSGRILRFSPVP